MKNKKRSQKFILAIQYSILVLFFLWMVAVTASIVFLFLHLPASTVPKIEDAKDLEPAVGATEPSDVIYYISEEAMEQVNTIKQGNENEVPEHMYDVGSTFVLSDEDRYIVEQVVMKECGNEPYEGIVAVAQCIYNTAVHKGVSPSCVVQVPGQYADPSDEPANDNVKQAVYQVFDREEFYVQDNIMYFYSPKYCSGSWHETSPNLEYSCTIGGHKFFKLKGE